MRFNILGFDQEKAFSLGLTIDELMILRHLKDFADSGRMESIIHDNRVYYWVKYDKFIDDLPILNIKKTRLMEIFNNNLSIKPNDWEERYNAMSESSRKRAKSFKFIGLLKGFTRKDTTGTYSYFTFTDKFFELIPNITDSEEIKKVDSKEKPPTTNSSNNSIRKEDKKYTGKSSKKIKTRLHNVNTTFDRYEPEELEKNLRLSQEGKFDNNSKPIEPDESEEVNLEEGEFDW